MSISPSVASALVAMLSSQGVSTTNERVTQLLAPLFGEPDVGSNDLLSGEKVMVFVEHSGEFEESVTLADALDYIKDDAADPWDEGTFRRHPSNYRIFITRKELEVKLETICSASWAE